MKLILNPSRVDELLSFIPKLKALEGEYTISWKGLDEGRSAEMANFPYPEYHPVVMEFFSTASKEHWDDYGYSIEGAGKMISDQQAVKNASILGIKTMLTWCVRGERFCDGHWGAVLANGKVFALLARLEELREEM